ncbi:MAG: hypothetical protein ABEK17_01015 [Candidatus Aenigmatarchaeota archaeon]
MKKLLAAFFVLLVASITAVIPVLANSGIPTGANVPAGVGDAPIIKAKWETVPAAGSALDDNPDMPWTQVNPPMQYKGKKAVKYWMVVTDPNGIGDLNSNAYVDVYHPDGEFKYQVELTEYYTESECRDADSKIAEAVSALENAYNAGLVTFGNEYTLQEVIDEMEQCSAKLYTGEADLDYHQMCGEFDWSYYCEGPEPCEDVWEATNMENGYRVDAYAFDKYNLKSAFLTNYFEYICTAGIEMDFDRLNFGNVIVSSNKWIEGDRTFDTEGEGSPACGPNTPEEEDCRAPTIRNIGNTPSYINVEFDDMGFGESTTGWNVEWDARLGLDPAVVFDPYENVEIGMLDLCNTDKISFSIHVKKATQTGGHEGEVMVEPEAVPFPWWSE